MNKFFVIDIESMQQGIRNYVPALEICTNPLCIKKHAESGATFGALSFPTLAAAQSYAASTRTPAPIGYLIIEVTGATASN